MHIPVMILKYIVSGITASVVMLASLAFFREILNIWYLYSSSIAFVLAFITSFLLQKFWTFQNSNNTRTHAQLALFLLISLANLGINGLAMFILVDKLQVWYFLAQIIVTGSIAFWSFFIYRVIFQNKTGQDNNLIKS